jgi:hypothetical protein
MLVATADRSPARGFKRGRRRPARAWRNLSVYHEDHRIDKRRCIRQEDARAVLPLGEFMR